MRGGGRNRVPVIEERECGQGLRLVSVSRGRVQHMVFVDAKSEGAGVIGVFSLPAEASAYSDFIYHLAQARGLGIGS